MWRQTKTANTYMLVKVYTTSTERLLNLCRHNDIYFWDINKTEYGFEGKITRKDFLKIKDICRKTKSKIRITKRIGIRFLLFKYRKHYSFLIGMIIAFVILYICGLFVWDVSFTGNSVYTDSTLIKYLKTINVYPGIKISEVNCNEIEKAIRSNYDDITWVSAQISGTRLIIHIKENDGMKVDGKENKDSSNPSDIIASESGVISYIVTRKGHPLVKKGDSVEKGQTLVSGVVEKTDDSGTVIGNNYVSSDADILINTTINYNDELAIEHEYKSYTGREIKKEILGFCDENCEFGFSFKKFDEYDVTTSTRNVYLTKNFCLPIVYGEKVYAEYEMKTGSYTQDEADKILNGKLTVYLRKLNENGVQILDNSVKMDTDGVKYILSGGLNVNMPAYEYLPITSDRIQEIESKSKTENNAGKEGTGRN